MVGITVPIPNILKGEVFKITSSSVTSKKFRLAFYFKINKFKKNIYRVRNSQK